MRTIMCLVWLFISGCTAVAPAPSSTLASLDERGSLAVIELKRWYQSITDDCGGPDKPGYLCSGIALRTTGSSSNFLPWDPTDSQIRKGSVAFSWLRQDSNFGKPFGNQNGLILYPNQAVPKDKVADLHVLCAFPINANTNQRPTLQGCGPITGYESTTDTCQALGIITAQQWLERYPQAGNYRVCGWDMRALEGSSAEGFHTAIAARAGLADDLWSINNEVLLRAWSKGEGGVLPVHSFFYVQGERQALAKAQYDQIRYNQHYQQLIPVVRVTFPENKAGIAAFAYEAQDQAVGRPIPTPSVDFEALAVGPYTQITADGVEFQLSGSQRGVSDTAHPGSGGRIAGKHLAVSATIQLVLEGAGRRLVRFSWGCNSYCGMQAEIAEVYEELSSDGPGAMRYGTKEFIIDGPEIIRVTVDSEEDDNLLVLDNLTVQALPAQPHMP
ncbi:hypothetical protein [Pseudomonas sp. NY5710]|uniref:hypothetical protein n=1 Tax=Pseudomonas TaxID=286 RepID=UPI00156EB971|nr:hypothetical protein [Pseudomonas sp. NY5710]QKL01962.1 hypothetical protein GEV39_11355 [Pseudomonas sp. NY5710]